jgi:hypothetical protein
VSIVSMLAISGCSGPGPKPDATASTHTTRATAAPRATATPIAAHPTIAVSPSQAAGIPTAAPRPPAKPDPKTLKASVLITLATVDPNGGGLLLGGYVSGVAEDGGDCQYIVTPAGRASFTIHQGGVDNNGSTSCGSTTVPPAKSPAGSYSVILRYVDAIGRVESDAVKVDIP